MYDDDDDGKFRTCNRSIYGFLDIFEINLVALFCTRSNFSTSVFLLGYQTLLAYSKCDLTKDLYNIIKHFLEI